MNSIDDISSTCENECGLSFQNKFSNSAKPKEKLIYNSESESDFDSENETIDVICENSDKKEHSVQILTANTHSKEDAIYTLSKSLFSNKMTINSKKCLETDARNCVNNPKNCVVNGRGNNFLIDNILGTSHNSSQPKSVNVESEDLEETEDEHNGIILNLLRLVSFFFSSLRICF